MKSGIIIGILASISLGFIFDFGIFLKPALPFLLGIVFFLSFLTVEFDYSYLLTKELLFYFIYSFVIMPIILMLISSALIPEFRIGLVLLAITPVAFSSPVFVDISKGIHSLIISSVIFSNIIAPFTLSYILSIFFDASINIPILPIFSKVGLLVFMPLILAIAARNISTSFVKGISKLSFVKPYILFLIIFTGISTSSVRIKSLDFSEIIFVIGIVICLAVLNFAVGYFLAKTKKMKRTLPFLFGHKNCGLALLVALASFDSLVTVPVVIYLISHHIINGFFVHIFRK